MQDPKWSEAPDFGQTKKRSFCKFHGHIAKFTVSDLKFYLPQLNNVNLIQNDNYHQKQIKVELEGLHFRSSCVMSF